MNFLALAKGSQLAVHATYKVYTLVCGLWFVRGLSGSSGHVCPRTKGKNVKITNEKKERWLEEVAVGPVKKMHHFKNVSLNVCVSRVESMGVLHHRFT